MGWGGPGPPTFSFRKKIKKCNFFCNFHVIKKSLDELICLEIYQKSDQGTLKIEGRTTHKFVYTRLLKFLLYSRAIQIDPCCSVQALYR